MLEILLTWGGSESTNNNHAEGTGTAAIGGSAHAEGRETKAYGEASHSEGHSTSAYSVGAHSEGHSTAANSMYSHAEGNSTQANGESAHAEGSNTIAAGDNSHAEGSGTLVIHDNSHASGLGTKTGNTEQFVVGRYNIGKSITLFEVGNGKSNNERANALSVYDDGTAAIAKDGANDRSLVAKGYIDNLINTVARVGAGIVTCMLTSDNTLNFTQKFPEVGSVITAVVTGNSEYKITDNNLVKAIFSDKPNGVRIKCTNFTATNLKQFSVFSMLVQGADDIEFLGTLNAIDGGFIKE